MLKLSDILREDKKLFTLMPPRDTPNKPARGRRNHRRATRLQG